jgi:hypothetical protein
MTVAAVKAVLIRWLRGSVAHRRVARHCRLGSNSIARMTIATGRRVLGFRPRRTYLAWSVWRWCWCWCWCSSGRPGLGCRLRARQYGLSAASRSQQRSGSVSNVRPDLGRDVRKPDTNDVNRARSAERTLARGLLVQRACVLSSSAVVSRGASSARGQSWRTKLRYVPKPLRSSWWTCDRNAISSLLAGRIAYNDGF